VRIVPALLLAAASSRLWPAHELTFAAIMALLAVATAALVVRLTHTTLRPLEREARQLAQGSFDPPAERPRYSEFDEISEAIGVAKQRLGLVLQQASGQREELEALLDSMQDAVFAVDADSRLLWTNQRARGLLLAPQLQPAGKDAVPAGRGVVHLVRDPEVLECVHAALRRQTVSDVRSMHLVPGRIFEVIASPMPDGGAVIVLHDITRVEQVERTQRDFVANVSHELRTPLTSITGYVETLLDHEASLSTPAREFLGTILKNAIRMTRLTEDLLILSRIESDAVVLHSIPCSAQVLVQDAVDSMLGLAQDTESSLEVGETTTSPVLTDADTVLQVLSGLIENAIKYGRTRSAPARVIVSSRVVPAGVEFSVQDFGQGIPSEHLPRIFERFYRVDKARSRDSGGTGLGLAIGKYMVEALGGTLRAESQLNVGSTFFFTLPRAPLPTGIDEPATTQSADSRAIEPGVTSV
jgi:two-component system phosphate regulon sensor histidine kinase PhoR